MKILSALALATAIVVATSADAAQTFIIKNAHFTDGAYITGSFTTDDALTKITDWSVATGAGTASSQFGPSATNGSLYTPAPPIFGPDFTTATLSSSAVTFADNGFLGGSLILNFNAPLSSAGATIAGGTEFISFFTSRAVAASGTLAPDSATVVPEPTTWGMMILGISGIGLSMRRRRKVAARVSYAA